MKTFIPRFVPLQLIPLLVALTSLPSESSAGPVYKSTDARGQVVYSNVRKPNSSPHALPEIMKGDFKTSSSKKTRQGCEEHGGLNCHAGQDSDGSIICQDGYRGALIAFHYVCPTPKLEILEVIQPKDSSSVVVIIKNSRPVTATKLILKLRSKYSPSLPLKGPATLEQDALGAYEVYIPKGVLPGNSQRVTKNQLLITCGNCG